MRPSFRAPRLLALAAGLLAADPASAQRVDAGLSAGFSRTSRWYETEGDPGSLAGGPALSADLRYWPVPVAGVRLQAGTFSGSLRTTRPESQRVLGIAYDASVVVRPLTESPGVPDPLASAYAYAGGGAVTLALSGEPDSIRTCPPKSDTGCVVLRARSATVAQFTAGAGTEVPLGGGLAVYVEGSVTAYEPPFRRRGPTGSSQMMSSRGAISPPSLQLGHPGMAVATPGSLTSRLVIGLRRTFGIRAPPPVVPPAAPPPAPPPTAPAGAESPTTGGYVEVRTAAPGAEVYLVPRTVVEDDPGVLCRLRPVHGGGSYFRGRTTAAAGLRAYASPRTWVVVVRQGGREFQDRVQLAAGRVRTLTLDLRTDGTPYRCPR